MDIFPRILIMLAYISLAIIFEIFWFLLWIFLQVRWFLGGGFLSSSNYTLTQVSSASSGGSGFSGGSSGGVLEVGEGGSW